MPTTPSLLGLYCERKMLQHSSFRLLHQHLELDHGHLDILNASTHDLAPTATNKKEAVAKPNLLHWSRVGCTPANIHRKPSNVPQDLRRFLHPSHRSTRPQQPRLHVVLRPTRRVLRLRAPGRHPLHQPAHRVAHLPEAQARPTPLQLKQQTHLIQRPDAHDRLDVSSGPARPGPGPHNPRPNARWQQTADECGHNKRELG